MFLPAESGFERVRAGTVEPATDSAAVRFRCKRANPLEFDYVRCCAARFVLKQSPHRTGLPVEGLNGTVSVLPH